MKLNDIVEHAKGRRAKIYNRKPKNMIEPHKPQAPTGPVSEAEVTLKPLAGAQEVEVDGKAVGTATTPQAATAISDLAKKGEFTPATSDNQQPAAMEDEVGTPYFVKLTGNGPVVKSGNGFTPIVASKIWDTMTPDIEAKAHTQGFRKITLSVNGAMIPALEGGGKVIVGKSSYGTIVNSQNEEHNHHGVDTSGDVGGDATDSFLDQIKLQPEDDIGHGISEMSRIRHLAGLKEADVAPQLNNENMDLIAKGVQDGLKSLPPEQQAAAEQLIVRDAGGDVDGDETMMKMFQTMADFAPQLYQMFEQLTTRCEQLIKTPEFAKQYPDPAEQQKIIKDVADMRAEMPQLKAAADQATQEMGKIMPQMRQAVDQRANTAFKDKTGTDMVRTASGAKTNIGTNPNQPGGVYESELNKWLTIAGLR
jgi:hypothetical protein